MRQEESGAPSDRSKPASIGIEYLTAEQKERMYTNLLIAVLSTVIAAGGSLTISPAQLRAAAGSNISVESSKGGGLTLRLTRKRAN